MYKANIESFKIRLPYIQTAYDELKKIGKYEWTNGKALWTFPLDKLETVAKLLGKPIEFEVTDVRKVVELCPPIIEQIMVPKSKPKGEIRVIYTPDGFEVCHGKTTQKHRVPIESVEAMWSVIERNPMNKKVKIQTIAKNLINKLGITRFHRETGSFDWHKFQGNRKDLLGLVYYPLKVLQYGYGAILHYKNGYVERLFASWEIQSRFTEPDELYEDNPLFKWDWESRG